MAPILLWLILVLCLLISVVKYLISRGVPPGRLVAAGFGEFQPLTSGGSDADLRRNRRIELKLTEK